ncbi:hypothetical protein EYF80_010108 [Liparis tanakae]|uniref:Uncharacterized protein n=1 Tax=Liparis tanakae TaxID=230148 RepID=A0A4Z2IQD7_9TELE|nr:hypothetical protein EYF80_010108 [Liparis tanakae]
MYVSPSSPLCPSLSEQHAKSVPDTEVPSSAMTHRRHHHFGFIASSRISHRDSGMKIKQLEPQPEMD